MFSTMWQAPTLHMVFFELLLLLLSGRNIVRADQESFTDDIVVLLAGKEKLKNQLPIMIRGAQSESSSINGQNKGPFLVSGITRPAQVLNSALEIRSASCPDLLFYYNLPLQLPVANTISGILATPTLYYDDDKFIRIAVQVSNAETFVTKTQPAIVYTKLSLSGIKPFPSLDETFPRTHEVSFLCHEETTGVCELRIPLIPLLMGYDWSYDLPVTVFYGLSRSMFKSDLDTVILKGRQNRTVPNAYRLFIEFPSRELLAGEKVTVPVLSTMAIDINNFQLSFATANSDVAITYMSAPESAFRLAGKSFVRITDSNANVTNDNLLCYLVLLVSVKPTEKVFEFGDGAFNAFKSSGVVAGEVVFIDRKGVHGLEDPLALYILPEPKVFGIFGYSLFFTREYVNLKIDNINFLNHIGAIQVTSSGIKGISYPDLTCRKAIPEGTLGVDECEIFISSNQTLSSPNVSIEIIDEHINRAHVHFKVLGLKNLRIRVGANELRQPQQGVVGARTRVQIMADVVCDDEIIFSNLDMTWKYWQLLQLDKLDQLKLVYLNDIERLYIVALTSTASATISSLIVEGQVLISTVGISNVKLSHQLFQGYTREHINVSISDTNEIQIILESPSTEVSMQRMHDTVCVVGFISNELSESILAMGRSSLILHGQLTNLSPSSIHTGLRYTFATSFDQPQESGLLGSLKAVSSSSVTVAEERVNISRYGGDFPQVHLSLSEDTIFSQSALFSNASKLTVMYKFGNESTLVPVPDLDDILIVTTVSEKALLFIPTTHNEFSVVPLGLLNDSKVVIRIAVTVVTAHDKSVTAAIFLTLITSTSLDLMVSGQHYPILSNYSPVQSVLPITFQCNSNTSLALISVQLVSQGFRRELSALDTQLQIEGITPFARLESGFLVEVTRDLFSGTLSIKAVYSDEKTKLESSEASTLVLTLRGGATEVAVDKINAKIGTRNNLTVDVLLSAPMEGSYVAEYFFPPYMNVSFSVPGKFRFDRTEGLIIATDNHYNPVDVVFEMCGKSQLVARIQPILPTAVGHCGFSPINKMSIAQEQSMALHVNVGTECLAYFEAEISFNGSALEIVDISHNMSGIYSLEAKMVNANKFKIVHVPLLSSGLRTGLIHICDIKIKAKETGIHTIAGSVVQILSWNGTDLILNGSSFPIEVEVTKGGISRAARLEDIGVAQDPVSRDRRSIKDTSPKEQALKFDLNCDGNIDGYDVLKMMKFISHMTSLQTETVQNEVFEMTKNIATCKQQHGMDPSELSSYDPSHNLNSDEMDFLFLGGVIAGTRAFLVGISFAVSNVPPCHMQVEVSYVDKHGHPMLGFEHVLDVSTKHKDEGLQQGLTLSPEFITEDKESASDVGLYYNASFGGLLHLRGNNTGVYGAYIPYVSVGVKDANFSVGLTPAYVDMNDEVLVQTKGGGQTEWYASTGALSGRNMYSYSAHYSRADIFPELNASSLSHKLDLYTRLAFAPQTHFDVRFSAAICGCNTFEIFVNCENKNLPSIPGTISSRVQTANFAKNFISELNFAGLPFLTTLALSSNRITKINKDVFKSMPTLEKLYISENLITTIESGAFNSLSTLQTLDLSNNKLSNIDVDLLTGLTSLQELNLDDNFMEEIPFNTFSNLTSLVTLSLKSNHLSTASFNITTLIITDLFLQNNKIYTLFKDLSVIENINNLNMQGNELDCRTGGTGRRICFCQKGNLHSNTTFLYCHDSIITTTKMLSSTNMTTTTFTTTTTTSTTTTTADPFPSFTTKDKTPSATPLSTTPLTSSLSTSDSQVQVSEGDSESFPLSIIIAIVAVVVVAAAACTVFILRRGKNDNPSANNDTLLNPDFEIPMTLNPVHPAGGGYTGNTHDYSLFRPADVNQTHIYDEVNTGSGDAAIMLDEQHYVADTDITPLDIRKTIYLSDESDPQYSTTTDGAATYASENADVNKGSSDYAKVGELNDDVTGSATNNYRSETKGIMNGDNTAMTEVPFSPDYPEPNDLNNTNSDTMAPFAPDYPIIPSENATETANSEMTSV
eukprot:m.77521 g.77521  ORF g.77521 m.77521 type:complete len:2022 (+) comp12630_c0_seq2:111-6176(+)